MRLWVYNEEWCMPAAMRIRPDDGDEDEDYPDVPDEIADRWFRALREFEKASEALRPYLARKDA